MIIEINKDIDKYQESIVLGLTARQLIFSVASIIVGGGIVLLLCSLQPCISDDRKDHAQDGHGNSRTEKIYLLLTIMKVNHLHINQKNILMHF